MDLSTTDSFKKVSLPNKSSWTIACELLPFGSIEVSIMVNFAKLPIYYVFFRPFVLLRFMISEIDISKYLL